MKSILFLITIFLTQTQSQESQSVNVIDVFKILEEKLIQIQEMQTEKNFEKLKIQVKTTKIKDGNLR